jgi:transposase
VPRPGRQKVTDEQIEAMTDLRRGGMTLEAIAQRFDVSESYVSFIVRGLRRQYRQRVAQRVAS